MILMQRLGGVFSAVFGSGTRDACQNDGTDIIRQRSSCSHFFVERKDTEYYTCTAFCMRPSRAECKKGSARIFVCNPV